MKFSKLPMANFLNTQGNERILEKYVNAGIIPDLWFPGRETKLQTDVVGVAENF